MLFRGTHEEYRDKRKVLISNKEQKDQISKLIMWGKLVNWGEKVCAPDRVLGEGYNVDMFFNSLWQPGTITLEMCFLYEKNVHDRIQT